MCGVLKPGPMCMLHVPCCVCVWCLVFGVVCVCVVLLSSVCRLSTRLFLFAPLFVRRCHPLNLLSFLFFPPLSALCNGRASWDWIYGYGTIHFDSKSSRSCSVDALHFWLAPVPPLNHVIPRLTDWPARCNPLKLQTCSVREPPSNIINMDVIAS